MDPPPGWQPATAALDFSTDVLRDEHVAKLNSGLGKGRLDSKAADIALSSVGAPGDDGPYIRWQTLLRVAAMHGGYTEAMYDAGPIVPADSAAGAPADGWPRCRMRCRPRRRP